MPLIRGKGKKGKEVFLFLFYVVNKGRAKCDLNLPTPPYNPPTALLTSP